jgi:hypothetical protein
MKHGPTLSRTEAQWYRTASLICSWPVLLILTASHACSSGEQAHRTPAGETTPRARPAAAATFYDRAMERGLGRYDVKRLLDSVTTYMTAAQVAQFGMNLSGRGMLRLPPGLMQRNIALGERILLALDATACAAFIRGQPMPGGPPRLAEALDSAAFEEWADLRARATAAELRGTPAKRVVNDSAMARVVDMVYNELPAREAARYDSVVQRYPNGSDEETCWFGRKVYAGALRGRLGEHPSRIAALTAMFGQ